MTHVVLASLTDASHAVVNKNPLEVSSDDRIRWTSNDSDIRVLLPADLVGGSPSDPPMEVTALRGRMTRPVDVLANPDARGGVVWYRYDMWVGQVQVNAMPHVIVT